MTVAEGRIEHLRRCDDNSIGHDAAMCRQAVESDTSANARPDNATADSNWPKRT